MVQLSWTLFFNDLRCRQTLEHVLRRGPRYQLNPIPTAYTRAPNTRTHTCIGPFLASTHLLRCVVVSQRRGCTRDSSCHLLPVTSRQCEPSAAAAAAASLFLALNRLCCGSSLYESWHGERLIVHPIRVRSPSGRVARNRIELLAHRDVQLCTRGAETKWTSSRRICDGHRKTNVILESAYFDTLLLPSISKS